MLSVFPVCHLSLRRKFLTRLFLMKKVVLDIFWWNKSYSILRSSKKVARDSLLGKRVVLDNFPDKTGPVLPDSMILFLWKAMLYLTSLLSFLLYVQNNTSFPLRNYCISWYHYSISSFNVLKLFVRKMQNVSCVRFFM